MWPIPNRPLHEPSWEPDHLTAGGLQFVIGEVPLTGLARTLELWYVFSS